MGAQRGGGGGGGSAGTAGQRMRQTEENGKQTVRGGHGQTFRSGQTQTYRWKVNEGQSETTDRQQQSDTCDRQTDPASRRWTVEDRAASGLCRNVHLSFAGLPVMFRLYHGPSGVMRKALGHFPNIRSWPGDS